MLYYLSKAFWAIGAPSRILELAAIVACCWAIAGSWRGVILSAALPGLLVLAGIVPVGSWLLMPLEARFPTWQATPQTPLNGIIALGGDSAHRVAELARLSRIFPNTRLVYSGRGDQDAAEMEIRNVGLDPARVILETMSRTTSENAIETARLVQPNAAEHWLLITSAAHMPRAIGCFRRAGFHVTADPVDFHTDNTSFGYAKTASQRVAQLDDAAKEWLGLIGYRIAGDTNALFPAP